jgi:hypothetical protein
MNFSETKNPINQYSIFYCEKCDYNTNNKKDYNKHLSTLKHQNVSQMKQTNPDMSSNHTCFCGQILNSRTTFWRHKKKCINVPTKENNPEEISNNLLIKLLSQNNDLQQLLLEQSKQNYEQSKQMYEIAKDAKITNNNTSTNNSHNNSHNTTNTNNHFNLQIYLNETCKDAVNLTDFVNSLQVKLKDLEETARLGYSEGVSKIFINGLNELDVCKRPIHCSDAKRETLYIKDKNEWTKDADKAKLTSAIKMVGKKNIQQIFEWQKKYPEYNDPSSRQNDKYLKMLCNAMNGSTDDEQEKNMEKIIRTITKEVVIDKQLV